MLALSNLCLLGMYDGHGAAQKAKGNESIQGVGRGFMTAIL
jgi:hypothetical protein